MKFKTTSYHYNLLKDNDRLAIFLEAIKNYSDNPNLTVFDIGCGSGILSYFAQFYFKEILAIEIDHKVAKYAQENLKNFKNIQVINADGINYKYPVKADLIICEMLDTALIDEEQIPVIINAKKYLKNNGKIIPKGVINAAELVNMPRQNIHYDDIESNTKYETISDNVIYDTIDFLDDFNEKFDDTLSFKICKDGIINGVKITTYTKLTDNIICGTTPMLNPPLLIPISEKKVKCNDLINVNIKYHMGQGIQTIKVNYK